MQFAAPLFLFIIKETQKVSTKKGSIMAEKMDHKTKKTLLKLQRIERTESEVYANLAKQAKNEENAEILRKIGREELAHAEIWRRYTNETVKANRLLVFLYTLMGVILGFTFTVKRMEIGEAAAQRKYKELFDVYPETQQILADEKKHEHYLIDMLDEERLRYVGSMVLGLNDALVELTGTLAGLTFALGNNRLVALSGIITGVSATLSMAASEFLSARSEGRPDALKSAIYTGIAYLVTVVFLILPYLLVPPHQYLLTLVILFATVVLIIFLFNFYISVAMDLSFKHRFFEMLFISLGTAAVSFIIGLLAKRFLGLDVG